MYLNKVILVGNITKDPELKSLPTGNKVCTFGLATNRTYKDSQGVRQEKTDFHNIVVWGKTAENVATYMKKGNQILIEGRIETRSWDDKNTNEKKYRTEIIAETVQFGSSNVQGTTSAPKPVEKKEVTQDNIEYPSEDINVEDIPF